MRRMNKDLLPMIADSDSVGAVYSGEPDAQMAVEMGFAILMDKPIIVMVKSGMKAPNKLILVADAIVEADITTPAGMEQAQRDLTAALDWLRETGVISDD
jgi:hypothetical protein